MTFLGNRVLKICALLLALAGTVAFWFLIKQRFDAGDSLPYGSSLRSDPLGVEVLFESLNSSGLAKAERNYFDLTRVQLEQYDTLVLSCFPPPPYGPVADKIQAFVTNGGGRVIFTLQPQAGEKKKEPSLVASASEKGHGDKKGEEAETKDSGDGGKEREEDASDGEECTPSHKGSNMLWRAFGTCDLPKDKDTTLATLNERYDGAGYKLQATLPVKAAVGLSTNLVCSGWNVVYACGDIPVVVERRSGKGSVVISALSYPFSNEAMRAHRETGFLLWVFGDSKRVLFDESHFGLVINRTVAKLIRKNNLHYALLAMLIPCMLYFRLAMMPLVPRYRTVFDTDEKNRHSSGSALSKLLWRSIPPREIVSLALEAWMKTNGTTLGRLGQEERDELESLAELNRGRAGKVPRAKHITAAYNEVVDFMKRRELQGCRSQVVRKQGKG